MKTKVKRHLFLLIIFCFDVIFGFADSPKFEYGLSFYSHLTPPEGRTSLTLEENKPFKLQDEFTMSFNLVLRNEPLFGTVFHIKTDDNQTIDFVFATSDDIIVYPSIIINNDESYYIKKWIKLYQDLPVRLTIYPKEDKIEFSYDQNTITAPITLTNTQTIRVSFGTSYSEIQIVPAPMDIRDVKISQSGKLVRHWELKQHNGNTCYDIVNNVPAYAQNPYWLIDNYIEWKNIYSYSGKGKTSIAFNSRDAVFYLLTGNNLSVLDPAKNTTLSLDTIKKGYPAMLPSPHLAYDTLTNNLISYDLNGGVVSTFSFDNLSWSLKEKRVNDPFYNNHAFAFSATDTSIYTFGGYGFYRFKNDLFKIKLNSGAIEKLDKIAQIFPRYSSASAVVGNTLYVFGGRGNKSGKQEFLISNFYDLYAIDLQSMHSHKLWDVKENMLEQDFILAPGMYYEPSDSSFYVASIEKGGILMKIFPNDSKWKYVSKPIGNYVSYKEMDFDLYYAPNQNKMFVVFNKTLSDLSYNLSIYSINLPLVEESAISQPIENKGFNGILIAVLIVVPFIIFLFYYHWRKSNRKKTDASARELPKKDKSFNLKPEQGVETSYFDRTKSAISFLGSFNVQDKRGKDITLSFTPRLKDLLILVLLNSAHHKQGILIKKLDNIIWEDKDKIAARNNRNVSLRKLRMLLDSIGNINIISDNGFLRIDLGEDIFCDYCTALEYIEKVKQNKENDGETLLKLIELLLYGSLLPNTIIEWLDNYKNNYSSLSIDLLNNLLQLEMEKQNTDLVLKIADTIFIHDPLSEEALFAKCIILYKSGKKGLAKNIYENYRKEHKTLLNTPYKTPFSKIVGNDENS